MRVTIRADASVAIGSGHVMRCLTLARALRDQGTTVEFVSRLLDGNLCDFIESCGFAMHRLSGAMAADWKRDADETRHAVNAVQDWLVVDHYGLDADWERQMRGCAKRILVIDDLANRRHDCEILLDQNYYPRPQDRYDGKVPPSCQLLLGPQYVLLAPQFEKEASSPRSRDGKLRRVLVFFGGSDPTRETGKALDAIEILAWSDVNFDVVVGAGNPQKELIESRCAELSNTAYYCQTQDMARLCSLADVALGAGGSANWERFKLGLPSIVVVTAENQRETVEALAAGKYIHLLGWHDEINAERMAEALAQMSKQPSVVRRLGKRALELMKTEAEGGVRLLVQLMRQV
jgi:UDP-2,4-diacetamido-2,4,6-trideoxy-beta-L-altropyranose hydrolase